MKEIQVSGGRAIALIDDDLYDHLNAYRWQLMGGRSWRRYAATTVHDRTIYMHRLVVNPPAGVLVDHRDGCTLNNQRSNLRLCTNGLNQANSKKRQGAASQYKGVTFSKDRGCWFAEVRFKNERVYRKAFASEQEAARAYDCAALRHFGEFALTNAVLFQGAL